MRRIDDHVLQLSDARVADSQGLSPKSTIQLFERKRKDFQASGVRLHKVENLAGGAALLLGRAELALEPVADGVPSMT
jgi:hypothetical protein